VDVKESGLTKKTEAWKECRELRRSRKWQSLMFESETDDCCEASEPYGNINCQCLKS
jgi:hypothetical protein